MEEKKAICQSPWCRGTFIYMEEEAPKYCPKCRSFDGELSGGVTWVDKTYEGSRFDGQAHPISINVQRAGENKKLW
jgi:hypothetical protein